MGKFILAAIISVLCFAIYGISKTIHDPVMPEAIALPLGPHNKTESARIVHDSYVEVSDVTLETIPEEAWCDEYWSSHSTRSFSLRCVWGRPGTGIPYAVAYVPVPIPASTDVARWEFDRNTLTARPVPREWLWLNFDSLVLIGVLSIVTLMLSFILFAWAWPQPRDIDSVDHGLT